MAGKSVHPPKPQREQVMAWNKFVDDVKRLAVNIAYGIWVSILLVTGAYALYLWVPSSLSWRVFSYIFR